MSLRTRLFHFVSLVIASTLPATAGSYSVPYLQLIALTPQLGAVPTPNSSLVFNVGAGPFQMFPSVRVRQIRMVVGFSGFGTIRRERVYRSKRWSFLRIGSHAFLNAYLPSLLVRLKIMEVCENILEGVFEDLNSNSA